MEIKSANTDKDPNMEFFLDTVLGRCAGRHLLLDLWNGKGFDNKTHIESILTDAAWAAGARILDKNFHVYSPNQGVTGVLILAESHISIHTWPEANFAAIDVFMCGECDPERTIPTIEKGFTPKEMTRQILQRGFVKACA